MKDFKGTKGKWEIEKSKDSFLISCNNPNWDICQTFSDTQIDKKNAKLIASAPEMFEMLKEFISDFDKGLIEDFQIPRDRFEQLLTKITE
jgi:hypothetical protein